LIFDSIARFATSAARPLCSQLKSRRSTRTLNASASSYSPVEPVARKHISASGLSNRVRIASGDFFKDPLPKAGVITMGMILHDWNPEKKIQQ
jgi:hypothetical protein